MDRLVAQVCFTEDSVRPWAYLRGSLQSPGGYKYISYLLGFHMGLLIIEIRTITVRMTHMGVPGNVLILKIVNQIIWGE